MRHTDPPPPPPSPPPPLPPPHKKPWTVSMEDYSKTKLGDLAYAISTDVKTTGSIVHSPARECSR